MRIEIDLPDWVDERRIVILAGAEEAARYEPTEGWKVKAARCTHCGACCGACPYLDKTEAENRCTYGGDISRSGMPFECLSSDGVGYSLECTIEWTTP